MTLNTEVRNTEAAVNVRWQETAALWSEEWTNSSFCVCVSGSVARGEATAYSDMDLLVIQGADDERSRQIAESIVGTLSRDIAHVSVTLRSLQDIRGMLHEDIRSWVAQMDAVYVAGNREVYCGFRKGMKDAAKAGKTDIIIALEALTDERYAQYGSAVALLEPNIKNSAGSLRDIHTIYYIAILELLETLPVCVDPMPPVRDVLASASLHEDRRHAIQDAYSFYLAVRAAMHGVSGHLHDSLDFELQRHVADALGFRGSDTRKGVELFMREYYRHARAVHVSLQLVFYDARVREGVNETTREHLLLLPEEHAALDDSGIMALFHSMAMEGKRPAGEVIRALEQLRDVSFGPQALKVFDRMLREGKYLSETLMFMHAHGFLSLVLPEFAALEHFFQHNVYHFFTADEHTLRAIGALEKSLREDAHAAKILDGITDRSVLHYAVLLHDIAKPIDLQRHEHVGADLVPAVLGRFGRSDIIATVTFLVRDHLRMEQLAFRRNIREISTLQPFVEEVRTLDRLDFLYLLTLADMSALNPGVLTDWKKELLRELYETAKQLMLSGFDDHGGLQQLMEEHRPTTSMNEQDFSIAVQDVLDGALMRVHFQHHRAYSEVTVFCLDRPMLLAQFSAALLGADCSIVDASIETRNDVVIDTFRLVDIFSGSHLRHEQAREVRDLIRSVCAGETDSELLFERYRRKWIRKLRRLPKKHVTVDVRYLPHLASDGTEQTIVEVYAPDTFGLLYRLASELSSFGLNVVFAKIATRVDGVVDSFYVVDSEGRAFTDAQRREQLRSRILHHITTLTQ